MLLLVLKPLKNFPFPSEKNITVVDRAPGLHDPASLTSQTSSPGAPALSNWAVSTSVLFLKHTRHISASGSLYLVFFCQKWFYSLASWLASCSFRFQLKYRLLNEAFSVHTTQHSASMYMRPLLPWLLIMLNIFSSALTIIWCTIYFLVYLSFLLFSLIILLIAISLVSKIGFKKQQFSINIQWINKWMRLMC